MKTAFALLTALTFATAALAVEVGQPAPDFTGTDINGKTIKLSDYKGKIVVLESYNSDCPFCNNQYQTGAMQDQQKDLTAKGVVWLIVNSVGPSNPSHRTPVQARQEWTQRKINATAWLDDGTGTIGHLYAMRTTPHMFVVDKDGTLVYDGAIDDQADPFHDPHTAKNYVSIAVNELLTGKPVTTTQTKPYGCAVHYEN
jgi:alkyl hydroperoxide reductase subunit AhpC